MYKTTQAFHKQLQWTQRKNGWKAEFHGAVDVIVEAPTLDACRYEADQIFDAKMAELVAGQGRKRNAKSR